MLKKIPNRPQKHWVYYTAICSWPQITNHGMPGSLSMYTNKPWPGLGISSVATTYFWKSPIDPDMLFLV